MLDKQKFKMKFKKKKNVIWVVIAITIAIAIAIISCFLLILKQGMLNIRGGTPPPNLF
jgi:hypothetical protein